MSAPAKTSLALVIVGVALFTLVNSAFIVPQTQQALVLELGKPVRQVSEPGLKWKLPFIQNVEFYDKRLLDFNASSKEVIAADQKRLIVDAFVRYLITDPLKFKQTVGDESGMRNRLNAILESSLREVLGQHPLQAVVSEERDDLMDDIEALVNAQAHGAELDENGNVVRGENSGFGIDIRDVRIMRADLPDDNAESVYKRMQTEREREAKEFRAQGAEDAQKIRAAAERDRTVLLAEAQKKAETIRGEGEKESTRIFAEAFGQDEEFFNFYRTMQAYQKTLNSDDTTLILSPDSDFLGYLKRSPTSTRGSQAP